MFEIERKSGDILQHRYCIVGTLSAKGGMGLVYQAADLRLQDMVVVKQSLISNVDDLRKNKSYRDLTEDELKDVVESSRQAFEREAKLLYGLRHSALPRVIDYFEESNGHQFLVMDFIEGDDLGELLKKRLQQRLGPFPLNQVLDWTDQILDALHYLHTRFEQPIIHRDIKPGNLKLKPDGQIVLLDFGLAKGARPGMAAAQSLIGGTLEYAPIEQLDEDENARQKTDPRSDLYSLAVTLHHLLSGQLPAKTISRVNAKAKGQSDPLLPICELVPDIPKTVSDVLQRAAAVYAQDRLPTAAEMRRLLRQNPAPRPKVITSTEKQESIVQSNRKIVVPLNFNEEAMKPPVVEPEPQTQSGRLKSLLNQVASWLDQPSSSTSPSIHGTNQIEGGASSARKNDFPENLGSSVKLEMIYVPGGKFTMGGDKFDDEKPPHEVTVPAFYIGKFQVTQAQWKAVMGDKLKPYFKGDDLPMESVSWEDAKEFCQKLTQMTNKAYRLPTEAEWEYACRAGTTGDYAGKLDEMAWYGNNSGKTQIDALKLWNEDSSMYAQKLIKNGNQTRPVGQKSPNAFGLHDMHGNVWEWCEDHWHDSYKDAPTDGSAWLSGGDSSGRVVRGGSWCVDQGNCRSAYRGWNVPGIRNNDIGFRVVVSARN